MNDGLEVGWPHTPGLKEHPFGVEKIFLTESIKFWIFVLNYGPVVIADEVPRIRPPPPSGSKEHTSGIKKISYRKHQITIFTGNQVVMVDDEVLLVSKKHFS